MITKGYMSLSHFVLRSENTQDKTQLYYFDLLLFMFFVLRFNEKIYIEIAFLKVKLKRNRIVLAKESSDINHVSS